MSEPIQITTEPVSQGTWPAALRCIIRMKYNPEHDNNWSGTADRLIIQMVARVNDSPDGHVITEYPTMDTSDEKQLGGLLKALGCPPSVTLPDLLGRSCLIETGESRGGYPYVAAHHPLPEGMEPVVLEQDYLVYHDLTDPEADRVHGFGDTVRCHLPPRARTRIMIAAVAPVAHSPNIIEPDDGGNWDERKGHTK